jgi:hypothetical protein
VERKCEKCGTTTGSSRPVVACACCDAPFPLTPEQRRVLVDDERLVMAIKAGESLRDLALAFMEDNRRLRESIEALPCLAPDRCGGPTLNFPCDVCRLKRDNDGDVR